MNKGFLDGGYRHAAGRCSAVLSDQRFFLCGPSPVVTIAVKSELEIVVLAKGQGLRLLWNNLIDGWRTRDFYKTLFDARDEFGWNSVAKDPFKKPGKMLHCLLDLYTFKPYARVSRTGLRCGDTWLFEEHRDGQLSFSKQWSRQKELGEFSFYSAVEMPEDLLKGERFEVDAVRDSLPHMVFSSDVHPLGKPALSQVVNYEPNMDDEFSSHFKHD